VEAIFALMVVVVNQLQQVLHVFVQMVTQETVAKHVTKILLKIEKFNLKNFFLSQSML
jgi:hypothetical protein